MFIIKSFSITVVIIFFSEFLLLPHLAQSQIYLDCKFDADAAPCRLIPTGSAPELNIESTVLVANPSVDPVMPLSDVTSITTPTLGNSSPCNIPYQLDGSSKNMYFCFPEDYSLNVSSCVTKDTSKQECTLGQYAAIRLAPDERDIYYIEVTGTAGPSCLSFYYYITRPNGGRIATRYGDILNDTSQLIGEATNVPFNGWHPIEFSFTPDTYNYSVYFEFQRKEYANESVFLAVDEIKIIDGECKSDLITTNIPTETPDTLRSTTTTIRTDATTTRISTNTMVSTEIQTNTALPVASTTAIFTIIMSSATTTIQNSTSESPLPSDSDLGLILGLSLGIGIPVILGILGGLIYYFKVYKPRRGKVVPVETDTTVDDLSLEPTNTANGNSTIAAVVV